MNQSLRFFALTVVAGIAFAVGQAAPSVAADTMAGPPDCAKADAMMMNSMPGGMHAAPPMEPKPSGNTDLDFAKMMMHHEQATIAMAKMEIACGKDAKTKAAAQKQLDQASADSAILQELLKNDAKI